MTVSQANRLARSASVRSSTWPRVPPKEASIFCRALSGGAPGGTGEADSAGTGGGTGGVVGGLGCEFSLVVMGVSIGFVFIFSEVLTANGREWTQMIWLIPSRLPTRGCRPF